MFTSTPQAQRPISTGSLPVRFAKVKALAGGGKASLHGVRHTYAHALPLNDQDAADYLAKLYELIDDKK